MLFSKYMFLKSKTITNSNSISYILHELYECLNLKNYIKFKIQFQFPKKFFGNVEALIKAGIFFIYIFKPFAPKKCLENLSYQRQC